MTDHDDYREALDRAQDLLGQPLELPLGPGEPAVGADFRRLATVHTFGDSWSREGLDPRYQIALAVFAERAARPETGE